MVWSCNRVRLFWSAVTAFISETFELPNICSPKWCLLKVIEDVELPKTKLFLGLLLYYTRKTVLMIGFSQSEHLHIGLWKEVINQNLPLYKLTYEASPMKFAKIWGP